MCSTGVEFKRTLPLPSESRTHSTTTSTTTFIVTVKSLSNPNLARLIELGEAKIKKLFNIFTMTKITKGHICYFMTKATK